MQSWTSPLPAHERAPAHLPPHFPRFPSPSRPTPQLAAKKLFVNYLEAKGDVDFGAFCALLQYMAPGKVFAKGVLVQLFEQVGGWLAGQVTPNCFPGVGGRGVGGAAV
jgi:hypothetical protein